MHRVFVFGILLTASACSSSDDLKYADQAVAQFHSEMNSGQFDRIYADAAPEWKSATSRDDTVKLFTGVHKKLGTYVSGKQVGWNVNYGTGGTVIRVGYESKFQNGDGGETFTFRRSSQAIQLIAYNINSKALITG